MTSIVQAQNDVLNVEEPNELFGEAMSHHKGDVTAGISDIQSWALLEPSVLEVFEGKLTDLENLQSRFCFYFREIKSIIGR